METLEFPEIQAPAFAPEPAPSTKVAVASATAPDLAKIDLKDVALAKFGDWKAQVEAAKGAFTNVVHDLSTQAKIDEVKSNRWRLIGQPRADARKVAGALKSKLASVSKAIGAELETAVAAFDAAEVLITPQIEAAEAKLAAEKAEKERVENERKQKHLNNIAVIAGYVDQAAGLPIERIERGIAYVQGIDVSAEAFEEFAPRAAEQKEVTIQRMQQMVADLKAKAAAEALRLENERLAAELVEKRRLMLEQQAEIDRQRKELEAAQRRAAAPSPAAGDDEAPAEPGAGKVDTPALEREATQLMTRPEEVGGQVDGCRAPEGQPVLCSGQHPQDHTSLPASPSTAPAMAAVETNEADESGPSPVEAAAPPAEADPSDSPAMSQSDILAQALELTQYAAGAFAGRFPSHPKPGPDWWAGLRARIEHLQPMLAAAREQR